MTAQDFATSVDRLITKVGHWEQSRWWTHAPAPEAGPSAGAAVTTKADLLYALVQHLADLGAEAEHRPPRPVPRLVDLALPDQLRVVADDLLAADPPEPLLKQASKETTATHHTL